MKTIKKFVAIVTLILNFQLMATEPVNNLVELRTAFDRLNYSIQVEWDQKDRMFYNNKVSDFKATVQDLQGKGLTNTEIIEFIKLNIKDKKIAGDIDKLFETVKNSSMTEAEIRDFIMDYVGKNYSDGANYTDSGSAGILAVGVLVILLVTMISVGIREYKINNIDSNCWEEYECHDYYDGRNDVWYTDCDWYKYCN